MGALALKMVSKKGSEAVATQYTSLWQIPTVDIDGRQVEKLAQYGTGKKCVMVVNVASKWGLTEKTYTQMVRLHN